MRISVYKNENWIVFFFNLKCKFVIFYFEIFGLKNLGNCFGLIKN